MWAFVDLYIWYCACDLNALWINYPYAVSRISILPQFMKVAQNTDVTPGRWGVRCFCLAQTPLTWGLQNALRMTLACTVHIFRLTFFEKSSLALRALATQSQHHYCAATLAFPETPPPLLMRECYLPVEFWMKPNGQTFCTEFYILFLAEIPWI
jgi:hypothetical protein